MTRSEGKIHLRTHCTAKTIKLERINGHQNEIVISHISERDKWIPLTMHTAQGVRARQARRRQVRRRQTRRDRSFFRRTKDKWPIFSLRRWMESVFARTEKYAAITYLFAPQRLGVNEKNNCTNILFALLIDEKWCFCIRIRFYCVRLLDYIVLA